MINKIKYIIISFAIVFISTSPANSQTYENKIMGYFKGWHGNSAYKLMNGGLLVQTDIQPVVGAQINPDVIILKKEDTLYALVKDTNTPVRVKYYSNYYRGNIKGEFKGWDGDTIYQLMDGHIVKQHNYSYSYSYAYDPNVIIINENGLNRILVDNDPSLSPIYVDILR